MHSAVRATTKLVFDGITLIKVRCGGFCSHSRCHVPKFIIPLHVVLRTRMKLTVKIHSEYIYLSGALA
jgi:hypothetical protein